jgi:outer membrane biosynthesis protein TonB
MSNNYSKQLSTEQITQKLDKLHYHFDDQYWNDFSQQYQGSRMQSVKMQAKFNPKFLAIPIGLVIIASIVYFSINNMRSENAAKESIVTTETEVAPEVKIPEEKNKTIVVTPAVKDTVKPEVKVVEVPKPVVVEQTAKVKPEKKSVSSDSSDKVVSDETARVKKSDSEENTTHKKKKKKKRRSSVTSNDAFTPSAEEDNVVIPEN